MPIFKRPELLDLLFPTVLFISVTTIASANTPTVVLNTSKALIYPNIDPRLSESLYPNEAATAKQIADTIEMSIRKQYVTDIALRDAHPKAHGCIRAEFKVNETLPPLLAQGVFIPGKTYQAWIRFSNGSSNAKQADIKKDARGMAIKLLEVSGKNLSDENSSTQDFIMINHPVFFANDPARYL